MQRISLNNCFFKSHCDRRPPPRATLLLVGIIRNVLFTPRCMNTSEHNIALGVPVAEWNTWCSLFWNEPNSSAICSPLQYCNLVWCNYPTGCLITVPCTFLASRLFFFLTRPCCKMMGSFGSSEQPWGWEVYTGFCGHCVAVRWNGFSRLT